MVCCGFVFRQLITRGFGVCGVGRRRGRAKSTGSEREDSKNNDPSSTDEDPYVFGVSLPFDHCQTPAASVSTLLRPLTSDRNASGICTTGTGDPYHLPTRKSTRCGDDNISETIIANSSTDTIASYYYPRCTSHTDDVRSTTSSAKPKPSTASRLFSSTPEKCGWLCPYFCCSSNCSTRVPKALPSDSRQVPIRDPR